MRVCEWCSNPIGEERKTTAKTCSEACRASRRLAYGRRYAAARHVPAEPLAAKDCERCGARFTPYTRVTRFCSRRCNWAAKTVADRPRTRPCYKCGTDTPTRPGKPVCDSCRIDHRRRWLTDHEARRRLRTYGLSQSQYDQMLVDQDGLCAICRTAQPGQDKAWAIDHCHATGAVRGLLCHPCNLAIGQMGDDPNRLRAAAEYLEAVSGRVAA